MNQAQADEVLHFAAICAKEDHAHDDRPSKLIDALVVQVQHLRTLVGEPVGNLDNLFIPGPPATTNPLAEADNDVASAARRLELAEEDVRNAKRDAKDCRRYLKVAIAKRADALDSWLDQNADESA